MRNGRIAIQGNTGKIHNITQEVELIGKDILDGLMLNQALLNGEMSGYSSAAVGVEILLRRLESWRQKLSKWVEKHLFEPMSMMQGFVDEEKSKRLKRTVYLYPTIKWNELNLRDKTNTAQLYMQMRDKGMIATQTLLEFMGLDYDTEIEKMREESVITNAAGQIMGQGGPGGEMGGMPGGMGGGPGGAPGGEMGGAPGGMPGGPGGAPGGMPGGAPGGMPGGDMGGGMAGGMGGGMAAAGAEPGQRVMKRGKKGKEKEEDQQQPPAPLKLTKLEAKMYRMLTSMNAPYRLFGQYTVNLPGQQQPFVLDFAYPEIAIGVETDGNIWHEREDLKSRDMERDQKLANVGWRILRFTEDAVEEHGDAVSAAIYQNIQDASKGKRKAAETAEGMQKFAALQEQIKSPEQANHLRTQIEDMPGGLGYVILIGN